MRQFDDEIRRYGEVIQSQCNPVDRLVVVTKTRKAQECLTQRIQVILGDGVPFEAQLIS